jgi:hypothetical protein
MRVKAISLKPMHGGVEDFKNIVEGLVIADLALWAPLGQGQMGYEKFGELLGTQLHGNGRRSWLSRRFVLFTT